MHKSFQQGLCFPADDGKDKSVASNTCVTWWSSPDQKVSSWTDRWRKKEPYVLACSPKWHRLTDIVSSNLRFCKTIIKCNNNTPHKITNLDGDLKIIIQCFNFSLKSGHYMPDSVSLILEPILSDRSDESKNDYLCMLFIWLSFYTLT